MSLTRKAFKKRVSTYKNKNKNKSNSKNIKGGKKKLLSRSVRKNFRKNMRGGISTYSSNNSIRPVNLGYGETANSTFSDSDTPSNPPSTVSYIPSPIMDLKWSIGTGLRNFFNEIFGQPRQFTSSPTDQPIGKIVSPAISAGLTRNQLSEMQQGVINTFARNMNK